MAEPHWLDRRPGTAWSAVAGLLCICALIGASIGAGSRQWLDWQPGLALAQPWRAWSAVAVHYSGLHLAANLAGAVLTAAFGVAAQVPTRAAWAWFAAWPLTQFGLLVEPALRHFGGLSGVLHAGVVIVVVWLLVRGTTAPRIVALLVLVGYAVKVISETPWGPPLRHPAGWDIAVAPLAHATGSVAGLVCALLALAWPNTGTTRIHG